MIGRRAFIVCGVAAIVFPVVVEAQKAKTPLVGVLSPWGPSLHPRGQREPFERGLRELGWIPNSTILIEQRYADGKPHQLPRLAMELTRIPVDVIVANGSSAIRAARDATNTIPIVMAATNDPVREGLVESFARPGGNVTGLSVLPQGRIEPKQLELLKQAVPGLTHVGVLAIASLIRRSPKTSVRRLVHWVCVPRRSRCPRRRTSRIRSPPWRMLV